MKLDEKDKINLAKLRKIERQAKLLIYKMKHLEKDWESVRSQMKATSQSLPKKLGDVLSRWNKVGIDA